jgi:hypothetical protein
VDLERLKSIEGKKWKYLKVLLPKIVNLGRKRVSNGLAQEIYRKRLAKNLVQPPCLIYGSDSFMRYKMSSPDCGSVVKR